MHRLAPASVHVKRQMSGRERMTIVAALSLFKRDVDFEQTISEFAHIFDGEEPLSPEEIEGLIREIVTARKVKVCRSKQRGA